MSSSAGTKVTTDPASKHVSKNENPGIVTSDSLAAESIQEGGSFGANADARGPHPQPSASTNTNTTDTSNATRLDPAPDAEARQASAEWSENSQLNAGSALGGQSEGKGPTYNTAAGGTATQPTSGGSGGAPTTADGNAAAAPGYASHPAPSMGDNFQPKGKNITEGGFEGNEPNASFTSDIGDENDPGRAALQRTDVPVSGGAGPRQTQVSGDGQFDNLDETSA